MVRALLRQDGQLVTFSEVVGMKELNGHKPIPVKNCKVRGEAEGLLSVWHTFRPWLLNICLVPGS